MAPSLSSFKSLFKYLLSEAFASLSKLQPQRREKGIEGSFLPEQLDKASNIPKHDERKVSMRWGKELGGGGLVKFETPFRRSSGGFKETAVRSLNFRQEGQARDFNLKMRA